MEYVKLVEKKRLFLNRPLLCGGAALITFSFFAACFGGRFLPCFKEFALPLFVCFLVIMFVFIFYFNKKEGALLSIALSVFGILYIAVPLGIIFFIAYNFAAGPLLLIYLLVVTKITDVGAYFGGKLFGKHKLAPNISPGKTVEGLLVGIFFAFFAGYLLSTQFLYGVIGGVLAFVGQIGDLCESLLKRDVGVKDSGVIPGLGGVLDMLDSLLFTAPFLFFILWFL